MTEERRDYETNGRGRRDYDKNIEAFCLHCDLRKKVNTLVSWKQLLSIFGLIGSIISIVLYLTVPSAIHGVERMVDTSNETLKAVHDVSERTAGIEARQDFIMMNMGIDHKFKHHRNNERPAD